MKNIFLFLFAVAAVVASSLYILNHTATKVVILLGPPGCGKGTQAKKIVNEFDLPHVSTGDLFRENIGKSTALGKKAIRYMNEGKLVPDELVLDMLFDRISRPDCKTGYLLDGFPRTVAQAEALERHLKIGTEVIAINLPVSDELLIQRISGRLSCPNCKHVYNIYFSPPSTDGICDVCQNTLIQRPDDSADVVKERLRIYKEQTAPVIEYYQKKGLLHTVDGQQSPELIFNQIAEQIK
jgi:adenylate kinase